MTETEIIWACVFWLLFVCSLETYSRRFWKRTDHIRFQWPRAIVTSRGFVSLLAWPVGLALISNADTSSNREMKVFIFLLYLNAAWDIIAALWAYRDLYKVYLRWRSWIAQPEQPDGEGLTFFYFGMDRQEQTDVLEHEPTCRTGIINHVYEQYKQTGIVKVPERVHDPDVKPVDAVVVV